MRTNSTGILNALAVAITMSLAIFSLADERVAAQAATKATAQGAAKAASQGAPKAAAPGVVANLPRTTDGKPNFSSNINASSSQRK